MLLALFFFSGFAALLYQVTWQRALFSIFGINVESVTVVVTAFMLGLGLGSLGGGALSRGPSKRLLLLFGGIEIITGCYGFVSLEIFELVGVQTLGQSLFVTAAATLLLVLLPTALMGSTLPLLVAVWVRETSNVGRSVGALYAVNTLGSAVASVTAVMVLLGWLGLQGSVYVAVFINVSIGFAVIIRGFPVTPEAAQ